MLRYLHPKYPTSAAMFSEDLESLGLKELYCGDQVKISDMFYTVWRKYF
jgi:hypothetical protein